MMMHLEIEVRDRRIGRRAGHLDRRGRRREWQPPIPGSVRRFASCGPGGHRSASGARPPSRVTLVGMSQAGGQAHRLGTRPTPRRGPCTSASSTHIRGPGPVGQEPCRVRRGDIPGGYSNPSATVAADRSRRRSASWTARRSTACGLAGPSRTRRRSTSTGRWTPPPRGPFGLAGVADARQPAGGRLPATAGDGGQAPLSRLDFDQVLGQAEDGECRAHGPCFRAKLLGLIRDRTEAA